MIKDFLPIIRLSPFAQSHHLSKLPTGLEKLKAWELAVPGEDRSVAAARLREVYEKQLTKLDLSGFDLLTTLPEELPANLTSLDLGGCSSLKTLPQNWPEGLTALYLFGCSSLTTLPQSWPANLTRLHLSRCTSLTVLTQSWPASLTVLDLSRCTSLKTLPQNWPANLTSLDLNNCSSLETLSQSWPAPLLSVYLSHCTSLTTLPANWPAGLTRLGLSNCPLLITLPAAWPANLTSLDLSGCSSLTTQLQSWPANLTTLKLNLCVSLITLPQKWPAGLTQLHLSDCSSLTMLPQVWPASLTWLSLSDCSALAEVPAHWPAGLAYAFLFGCSSLTGVPYTLPADLQIVGLPSVLAVPAHEKWYEQAQATPEQVATLKAKWPPLTQVVGFNTFNALLIRLGDNKLKSIVIPSQVVDVIAEVMHSPQIRPLIFDACHEADQDCHDRVLVIFNTIQALAKASSLQRLGGGENDIIALSKAIVKQSILDEAVLGIMKKQWNEPIDPTKPLAEDNRRRSSNTQNTGPNVKESVEVQLALRHQLAGELGLPFPVNGTLYTAIANLNGSDLEAAKKYVNDAMVDVVRVREGLLAQPIWRHYLTQRFPEEIDMVKGEYTAKLNAFEETRDANMPDGMYKDRLVQISNDRENDITTLLRQKTVEIVP